MAAGGGPIKYASIVALTVADNTVVAAVPGKQIRLVQSTIGASVAGSIQWKSGTNAKSGALPLAVNAPVVEFCDSGIVETNQGEALVLTVAGAGATVHGHIAYVEV